jgi:hypothetical protein
MVYHPAPYAEQGLFGMGRSHHYDPNQPRVPPGNPDGGQWTSSGRVRLAANTPPGRRTVTAGRFPGATPGQEAQLAAVEARTQDLIRRVQERDPGWRPTPSLYEGVNGAIRASEAEGREAEARLSELQSVGIGPGPFARDSIPARGPGHSYRAWEVEQNNRNGAAWGCHTCGTKDPGTMSGNWVRDHQLPTTWTSPDTSQRIYPQCVTCSARQGHWLSRNRKGR